MVGLSGELSAEIDQGLQAVFPGHGQQVLVDRLAQAAANLIEDRALDEGGLEAVAGRLGITDRHLRRAFGRQYDDYRAEVRRWLPRFGRRAAG